MFLSEAGANIFKSNMELLGSHTLKYTSDDTDHVLIILSRILTDIEDDKITVENLQEECDESDILTIVQKLLKANDKMITYLAKKLLCRLLDLVPGIFVDSVLADNGIASFDSNDDGITLSLLETIYKKMKKSVKEDSSNLQIIHYSIVHTATSFIANIFKSSSRRHKDKSKVTDEHTHLNGDSIVLTTSFCGNDMEKMELENLLITWNTVLMLLKITKHQCELPCTEKALVTPAQYSQLVHCVCGFVSDLCEECVITTRLHLVWGVLIKALQKIIQISVFMASVQDGPSHGVAARTALVACWKLSSTFCSGSFLRRLVLVENGFCGPGELESTEYPYEAGMVVMDSVTGRRLILFLLQLLETRNSDDTTQDGVDLTLSASLHLLNMFPAVKGVDLLNNVEKFICVFSEQDDQLLCMAYIMLNIYLTIRNVDSIHHSTINPHHIFRQLLRSISYDETVLLDWLTSTESKVSCSYFKDYLLFMKEDFQGCMDCLHGSNADAHTSVGEKRRLNLPYPTKRIMQGLAQDNDLLCKVGICELRGGGGGGGLVGYSSSEEDDEEIEGESGTIKASNLDCFFSCLIRLNLKLDRLRTLDLVEEDMSAIISALDDVESLYEENL